MTNEELKEEKICRHTLQSKSFKILDVWDSDCILVAQRVCEVGELFFMNKDILLHELASLRNFDASILLKRIIGQLELLGYGNDRWQAMKLGDALDLIIVGFDLTQATWVVQPRPTRKVNDKLTSI
jgi:hypothetical protein